jgi:hypothetical protein
MNAAVSFALAEALWAEEKSQRDALDLYEKAVALAGDNNVYQSRLKEARSQLAG